MIPGRWRHRARTLLILFLILTPFLLLSSSTTLHRFLLIPVQKMAGVQIRIQGSGLSILRGEFRIEGLQISDLEKRFEFSSSLIRIALSPLSLLKGQVIVSKFEVEAPRLALFKKSEKKMKSGAEVLDPFFTLYEDSIILHSIVIKEALLHSLHIERPGEPSIRFEEIQFRIEPKLSEEIQGKIALRGFSQEGHEPIDLLELDLTIGRAVAKIHSLELIHKEVNLLLSASWRGNLERGDLISQGKFSSKKFLTEPVSFQIESEISGNVAQINKAAIQMGPGRLEGHGSVHLLTRLYSIDFEASDLPVELIFQKIDSPVLAPARGIGEVKGKAEGRLPGISARADATIRHFRHNQLAADHAGGQIRLQWPRFEFEAHVYPEEADHEVGQVTGSLSFERRQKKGKIRTWVNQIEVAFQEAPISKLLPEGNLAGILSGKLHLKGAEKDGEPTVEGNGEAEVLAGSIGMISVESLASRLRLEPGGLFFFEETVLLLTNLEPILLPQPVRLEGTGVDLLFSGEPSPELSFKGNYNYKNKRLDIERLLLRSTKGDFLLKGVYHENLDLVAKGPLPISFLQMFRSHIGESSGWSDVDLKIQGTFEDPEVIGHAFFEDSTLEIRGLRETFSELRGKLDFEKKNLLPDLKGRFGNGKFSLKGTIAFEKLGPGFYNLNLNGTALPFQFGKDLNLEINSRLDLKGPSTDPLLAGKLEIVDGRYTKRFEVHKFVLKPIAGEQEKQTGEIPKMRLDLDVKSVGDLQIKNNIAEIYLSCDLQVKGTSQSPKILGAFSLIEGQFQYLTARFTMTEGYMEYRDPQRPDPYLVLRGERELPPDYVVYLKIEGYFGNLAIDLSSTPSRDRDDILSLLAFGMTRDEFQRASGLGTKIGLDLALEEAARPFTGIVSKATGLDVRLKPTAEGPYSPSRLTLESEVTDRLSLELKSDLAPETAERTFQANYYLTDNILLKGFRTRTASTEPQYHFNLSLRFKIQ